MHRSGDVPQGIGFGTGRRQCWVIIRGIKREHVERGQVVAQPGSITPHTKFKAETYILEKRKADAIRHFSMGIVRSLISGRQM